MPRRKRRVMNLFMSDPFDFLHDTQPMQVTGKLKSQIHSQSNGCAEKHEKNIFNIIEDYNPLEEKPNGCQNCKNVQPSGVTPTINGWCHPDAFFLSFEQYEDHQGNENMSNSCSSCSVSLPLGVSGAQPARRRCQFCQGLPAPVPSYKTFLASNSCLIQQLTNKGALLSWATSHSYRKSQLYIK